MRLSAGTLYGALTRLVDDAMVTVQREEGVGGRRRRYYALSEQGRAALVEEAERLHARAEIVRSQPVRRRAASA